MVGNATSVTTAPARTSAPSVPQTAVSIPATEVKPSGKPLPQSGGSLPPPAVEFSVADLSQAVQRLSELMGDTERSLRFRVDEISGRTVITVIDATTHEVVRQIPPPEYLALVRHLERAGSLLDTRV